MNNSRRFLFQAVTALMAIALPCVAQEKPSSQPAPDLSGSGIANHIAGWKNSTTLGNTSIVESGGNVGIGTSSPVALLEVNGNAQVDGDLILNGSILEAGVGQLLWAPNNGYQNFSAGLGALPATTTGSTNTAVGYGALAANTS